MSSFIRIDWINLEELNMQLVETWVDRPVANEQIRMSTTLITDICRRRDYINGINTIFNIDDTSPQYNEHYTTVANMVLTAINNQTPIIIAGDYDVDGMTATSVLYRCITAIRNSNVTWWIPSRDDGYGINAEKIMEVAQSNKFQSGLVITVDNGIAAAEEIAKLPPAFKVIVTDHHLADGKELPKCEYILDPKVFAKEEDDEYMISGCFVAAKLGLALLKLVQYKDYDLITYCEVLTGLSILSDMIPMNNTVRNIMSLALIGFNTIEHPGLRSLMTLSGFRYGSDVTTNFLAFILIPKLNAAGRMNRVDLGMKLLLDTEDTSEGGKDSLLLANELINCNRSRKTLEDIMVKEAFTLVDIIYHRDDDKLPPAIVVHKSDWSSGIVGIVAARLADLFKVPVICLTGKDTIHGSGRAPEGYDLYNGLEQCKELLLQFGGHKVAGGLSLEEKSLPAFREAFSKVYASQQQQGYTRYIDAVTSISAIKDVRFQLFLKKAEPFGNGNEPLNIRLNNVTVINSFKKGESFCLILADNTDNVLVSKYRAEDEWYNIPVRSVIDIVVTPNLSYFTGTTLPEYRAVAFKYSGLDTEVPSTAKVYTNEEAYKKAIGK